MDTLYQQQLLLLLELMPPAASGLQPTPPLLTVEGCDKALQTSQLIARERSAHYVVSASNRASRTLHAELGFTEVTDDFVIPGLVFSKHDGILCRLDARPDAEVIDLASRRS